MYMTELVYIWDSFQMVTDRIGLVVGTYFSIDWDKNLHVSVHLIQCNVIS